MSKPRFTPQESAAFHVGSWCVDPRAGEIRRGGETVRLEPKVMEVLVYLAASAGETISAEELLENIWDDSYVSQDALWRCISTLRRALDDDARDPDYIETLPRRGYRLVAGVRHGPPPGAEPIRSRAARKFPRRVAVALALGVTVALSSIALLLPIRFGMDVVDPPGSEGTHTQHGPSGKGAPAGAGDGASGGASSGVPRTAEEYVTLALEYYRRYDVADVEKAIHLLERALELEPEMAPAWAALADAYSMKSDRFTDDPGVETAALRAARRAVELDPQLAAGHKALGFAYASLGQVALSVEANRRALQLDPERYDAMHNLSHALAAQGRPVEAIAWQRKLIRAGFASSDAFMTLGFFHLVIGDLTEARRALQASLKIEPFAPQASWYLGWVEIAEGNRGAARRLASSCLEVQPGARPCNELLALLEQLAGNRQAARALLEESPAVGRSTNWTIRLRRGAVLAELGNRIGSETIFNAVQQHARERMATGNDHWMQRARLAIVAAWRGQRQEAMEWLDRALEAGLVDYLWLREDPLFRPFWDDSTFWDRVDELARLAAGMRERLPSSDASSAGVS